MPNTVIQLKKSSTPGSSPSSGNLANGELAINFADGVIYYKNLVGQVAQFIAPGRNFGTVNANGTLLVSAIAGDVFTILPGQNITVTGDAVNDRVTIGADLTSANGWANTKLSNGTVTLAGALTTTGSIYANGVIYVTPVGGQEGGEIKLQATGSNTNWNMDSYQNNFRLFAESGTTVSNVNFFHAIGGGSIRMGVNRADPGYTLDVNGIVNASAIYVNGAPMSSGSMDYPYANLVGSSANAASSANDASQGANIAVLAASFVSNSQSLSANVNTLAATFASANANNISLSANVNVLAAVAAAALANTSGVSFNGNLYFPTGNVGIGTSNPQAALDVYNASRFALRLTGPVSNGPIFDLYRQNTRTAFIETDSSNNFILAVVQQGPSLSLRTNGGAGPVNRLLIDTSGNVAIGTATANAKLDIGGDATNKIRLSSSSDSANFYSEFINYYNSGKAFEITHGGVSFLRTAQQGYYNVEFGPAQYHWRTNYGDGYISANTNSAERMRITSTGRVGIGTIGPTARLHVTGAASTTALLIEGQGGANYYVDYLGTGANYSDATTHYFRGNAGNGTWMVLSNGNVGIGNTAPDAKLHVAGTTILGGDTVGTMDVKFSRLLSGTRVINHWFSHSANSPWYLFGQNMTWTGERTGTVDPTHAHRPYYEAYAPVVGYKEFGFANVSSGSIASSNLIANMVLTNTGNIGMGTLAPTEKLHVVGNILLPQSTANTGAIVGAGSSDNFTTNGVIMPHYGMKWASPNDSVGPTGFLSAYYGLRFFVAGSEAVRIDANTRNIGIGTTSPASKLHIDSTATLINDDTVRFQYDNGTAAIRLIGASASPQSIYFGTSADNKLGRFVFDNSNQAFYFTSNASERLRITNTGNVGIGTTTPAYKLQVNGSFAANTKSFVIDHPTKPGMKLRYGSLEGPENGVYVRGRLDGIKVIKLPDYWEGLVDLNTITVQLTAIGHAQNLYVAAIDGLKIHIDTENHTQPYCFYHIYGERKDVEKLVVEFEA